MSIRDIQLYVVTSINIDLNIKVKKKKIRKYLKWNISPTGLNS